MMQAINRGVDRLFSRWGNVGFNLVLAALFAVAAFASEPGFAREVFFFTSGTQFGFAVFWLVYPRFSAARKREMETHMSEFLAGWVRRTKAIDRLNERH